MVTSDDLKSLPEVCIASGERVDGLRLFLRRRPDLLDLARVIGGLRVYDAAAVERILGEYRARRKRK